MLAAVYKSNTWCIYYVQCGIYFSLFGLQSELCWQLCTRVAHGVSIISDDVYISSLTGIQSELCWQLCTRVVHSAFMSSYMVYSQFNWYTKWAMLAALYKSNTWCIFYVQCGIYFSLFGIQSELCWQLCTRVAHGVSIISDDVYISSLTGIQSELCWQLCTRVVHSAFMSSYMVYS